MESLMWVWAMGDADNQRIFLRIILELRFIYKAMEDKEKEGLHLRTAPVSKRSHVV